MEHLASLTDIQITASIEHLGAGSRGPATPGELRRLTLSQYNNSVRDLLTTSPVAEVIASQLSQHQIVADLFQPLRSEAFTSFPLTFRIFARLV